MMPIMNIAHFLATSDIVVIGTDPEMADVDNPRGNIHGIAGYVVAEDKDGNRKRWHVLTLHHRREREVLEQCEKLVVALTNRLAQGKNPVAFDHWQDTFPAYGSAAYSEEDTVAWERSLEEA